MSEQTEDPDAALVAAVAARDEVAFTVLYGRYLPVVLRWCLRETGNREVAADLSSEVFAAALISARRYRSEQGSVLAWLLGIARNKLLESRRRRRVEDSARRRLRLEPVALSDADLDRVEELASLDDEISSRELVGSNSATAVEGARKAPQPTHPRRPPQRICTSTVPFRSPRRMGDGSASRAAGMTARGLPLPTTSEQGASHVDSQHRPRRPQPHSYSFIPALVRSCVGISLARRGVLGAHQR
ncbi:MAG: RNA polymerase sigma factor [Solirubrobacterales bacterium]